MLSSTQRSMLVCLGMDVVPNYELQAQRRSDLAKLADNYHDSDKVLQFLVQAEHCDNTHVGIEPIVFTRGSDRTGILEKYQAQFLQIQIEEACKDSESYLILTPKFSLYSHHEKADPLVFDDEGNIISGQTTVADAFNQTKALARKYKKTIVLSSLCEKRTLQSGTTAVMNTTVAFLPSGEVRFRRKVGEIYTNNGNEWVERTRDVQFKIDNPDSSQTNDPDIQELIGLTYDSLTPVEIEDNKGSQHQLAVIICNERGLRSTYKKIPKDADIIAVPISEGSFITSSDISAVAAFGESTAIRYQLGARFNEKGVTVAITNERGNSASVITFDGENISTIFLK